MHNINEISIEHIARLDEDQLNKLLERLLYLESAAYGIQNPEISVPENSKSKDGGVDGRIELKGSQPKTPRILGNNTYFQNKATELTPSACYEEVLLALKKGDTSRKLKRELEKVLKKDSSYILFTTQACSDQMKGDRVAKIREAFKDAGFTHHPTVNIRVFDANEIKAWTNLYTSAVDLVQGFAGVTKPVGYRDWNTTGIDIGADVTSYQSDAQVTQHVKTIKDNIIPQKVIRVIGHSGIGKTRLVFEAFRPNDDHGKMINAQFMYCDIGVEGRYERLENYISSHRNTQSGIIVVDNCDMERHRQLSNLVRAQGEFKLITIGFDDNKSVSDVKVKIDRQEQKDLVRQIIQQQLGNKYLTYEIDYVAKLCEGYPWMAVRYCEVINKSGITGFDKFFEDEAIEKLVFGAKPVNYTELNILRACSVFSAFGFVDDSFANIINENYRISLDVQTDFIRTEVCDEVVTPTRFKEICLKFKGEDIIEQRGAYYVVKPTVLAIQLAAKWLMVTPFDKIREIIEKLKTVQLEQRFLDRLTDLDQLDKAKDIVEELFGMNSSFGSAEVLKTEWGSLLFRYVVEVNPEVTCDALVNAFKDWNKADLLRLTEGRRNLIWALEKLCFHKETFYESTKFLFRLAVSENETWANNASGQIAQFFQRFLAGTEADYHERLDVLQWAFRQDDAEYDKIALNCLSQAFIPQGQHHRSGGAENQGGGAPLVDFMPKTWKEIFEYWKEIFKLLLPITNSNGENAEYALKIVARSVRTLITENASDILFENLGAINNRSGSAWLDIRAELQKAITYDNVPQGNIYNGIIKILDDFKPKNIQEEFLATIILPEWSYDPPQIIDGVRVDKQQHLAEQFALRLINDQIEWREYIPSLLEGEQRQTYYFGRKIGELDKNAISITRDAIESLKKIEDAKQNPGLIMGLLSGIDEAGFYDEILKQFAEDPRLDKFAINLSKLYSYSIEQLSRLFELVDSGRYPITIFDNFRFGKQLDYLSNEEFQMFIDRIASYGNEGIASAFSVLFMHCFQDEENWSINKTKIRALLMKNNLLIYRGRNLEPFYWSTSVVKLLKGNADTEFASSISMQIREFCDDKNFNYRFDSYLHEVFELLFEEYFEQAWPIISEALSENYLTIMHLKSLAGTKNGNNAIEGVMFKFPANYERIYDWLALNQRGQLAVANMMPFSQVPSSSKADDIKSSSNIAIHPFAIGFLDRFGDDEKVLDEVAANLGSFSTVGGSEWYFKLLMDLVSTLKNHPKRELRAWAKRAYTYYEKSLKLENLQNQNRELE